MVIWLSIFLSLVVGMLGRKTMFGFWGNFLLSFLLTPIVPLIYILIAVNVNKNGLAPSKKA